MQHKIYDMQFVVNDGKQRIFTNNKKLVMLILQSI